MNRGYSKLFKHCCPLGSSRGSKPCTRHRVWSDSVLIVARSWPYVNYNGRARVNTITLNLSSFPDKILSPGYRNLLWGGGAVLPEGRQCMRSCLNGGGGSPLTTGGGGGGGCSRQVKLTNSSLTCTHSLLKHKEHHDKRVHSAPAISCSTASLTFVRTTEQPGLSSMAQHVICRSLSSGRGGRHFIRDEGGGGGGGGPPFPRLCWIRG